MAAEGSKAAVVAALVGNTLIAILKFAAAAITQSAAMLAEGFHSVADVGNQVLLMRGLTVSRRQPDVKHPFGRGKEIFFWSFMVAVMLFVGGSVLAIVRGIDALRHPHEVSNIGINFAVLGLAVVIESFAFRVALRQFNYQRGSRRLWKAVRETSDTTVLVVLFEDAAAMTGLVIAGAGLALAWLTGNSAWDAVASIAIGLLLAVTAVFLAIETKALLVGEAATRRDRAAIRAAVLSIPAVVGIGRLLTMYMGPESILVNIDVDLADGLTDVEVERAVDDVEAAISGVLPQASEIFVELETLERG